MTSARQAFTIALCCALKLAEGLTGFDRALAGAYAGGMNYRHAFHAGNHADVLKHAALARALWRLAQKDKAFAVLDAHAGLGLYDLASAPAEKTREWEGGVGRLVESLAPEAEEILTPYRAALAAVNRAGALRFYPGSPEIALQAARDGDRVIANELHAGEAAALRQNYMGEKRLTIMAGDAMAAVKMHLPFKERRGLTLIDPPYEVKDEIARVLRLVREAAKRLPAGCIIVWYPVTTATFVDELQRGVGALGLPEVLQAELRVKRTHEDSGLSGSGLFIFNPPYQLEEDLRTLLPALAERLGIEGLGRFKLGRLSARK